MNNAILNKSAPFFSVIVPAYNVQQYLKQCIDSILAQSFIDYEVILVNDCSTDTSGNICDEAANRDNRINVVHKPVNEGLGCARNTGLDNASGQYVLFLDSDDFLTDENTFLYMHSKILKSQCDLLIAGYEKYFDIDNSTTEGMLPAETSLCGDRAELIRKNTYKALAWNKIVKRELINDNHLRFPSMRYSEDTIWCYQLLKYAKNIDILTKSVFAYRQREGSIVSQKDRSKQMEHITYTIESLETCVGDIKSTVNCDDEQHILYSYLAYEYAWLLGKAYPFWRQFGSSLKKLQFLMNYDLSDKVKKVVRLNSVFPLKATAFACYQFITHK